MLYLHEIIFKDNSFYFTDSNQDAEEVVKSYSRSKFGSVTDLKNTAAKLANKFVKSIREQGTEFHQIFNQAKKEGKNVVMFAPGYRNVQSSSNTLVEIFGQLINIELARLELPTIILLKLTRINSNPANYATLSEDERKSISISTRSIMPSPNLFKQGAHVIFCDDIKITGSTVDRVREECIKMGALSFSEVYALKVSDKIASEYPAIEDVINNREIVGILDANLAKIFLQKDFRPVQRVLRLLLNEKNRNDLELFAISKNNISDNTLVRLCLSAINNDYLTNEKYCESLRVLLGIAIKRNLLNEDFQPININDI